MKLFFSIILIVGFAGIFLFLFSSTFGAQFDETRLYYGNINDAALQLSVAYTEEARLRGLSGMPSLPEHHGLLFAFPESERHGIWMKGMNFSIDILWLNEDMRVVHIEERVSPDTYPRIFYPENRARYVLETNAGFVEQNSIRTGSRLSVIGYSPILTRITELFTF